MTNKNGTLLRYVIYGLSLAFAAGGIVAIAKFNTSNIRTNARKLAAHERRIRNVELAQEAIPYMKEDLGEIKASVKRIEDKI